MDVLDKKSGAVILIDGKYTCTWSVTLDAVDVCMVMHFLVMPCISSSESILFSS